MLVPSSYSFCYIVMLLYDKGKLILSALPNIHLIFLQGHERAVNCLVFISTARDMVASGSDDHNIHLWKIYKTELGAVMKYVQKYCSLKKIYTLQTWRTKF